jgi:hypothetical protein
MRDPENISVASRSPGVLLSAVSSYRIIRQFRLARLTRRAAVSEFQIEAYLVESLGVARPG